MGNVNVHETAAEYFIEIETSEYMEELWLRFHAWINEAPEHRVAYIEVEQAWRIAEQAMQSVTPYGRSAADCFAAEVRNSAVRRTTRRKMRIGVGIASGVVAVVMGIVGAVVLYRATTHAWNRYETAYGQSLGVTLRDGSSIRLNTNSRLWVRLTPQSREVALEQGEALFSVKPNKEWPFTVHVDHDELQAKGTKFSVRREQEDVIDACVQEGSIQVPSRDSSRSGEATEPSPTMVVKEGDTVLITSTHTEVKEIGTAAVAQRLAWTTGKIDFDGTLSEAVSEFNRYNQRKLEIADPGISERHIQGLFEATDPDEFAEEVHRRLGVRTSSTGSALEKTGVITLGE